MRAASLRTELKVTQAEQRHDPGALAFVSLCELDIGMMGI